MMLDRAISSEMFDAGRKWFATLLLDHGDVDIAAWEAWLAADPLHGQAYDLVAAMFEASQQADALVPDTPVMQAVPEIGGAQRREAAQAFVPAMRAANDRATHAALIDDGMDDTDLIPVSAPRSLHRLLALAALLIAVVGLGILVNRSVLPMSSPNRVAAERLALDTPRGQHRVAHLADGSRIVLGGATHMTVALTPATRDVALRSGQMFVNVAKDHARPFVISTPFSSVTAVGTAFDVDLRDGAVAVTVFEGTVLVNTGAGGDGKGNGRLNAGRLYVQAGQSLLVDGQYTHFIASPHASGVQPLWVSGRLEYRDVALHSVLADVNRYAAAPIMARDAPTGALRYTGSIDIDQIDPWLTGLAQVFDLRIARSKDSVLLEKKS